MKKTKTEDFGKKIGGARKDLWKLRGLTLEDLAGMSDAEKAKNIRPKKTTVELLGKQL